MKELSIEEKAKRYDKKMKEAIIATIHLYYGEPLEDEAKEMVDWLENQDEQKSIQSEEIEDEEIKKQYRKIPIIKNQGNNYNNQQNFFYLYKFE